MTCASVKVLVARLGTAVAPARDTTTCAPVTLDGEATARALNAVTSAAEITMGEPTDAELSSLVDTHVAEVAEGDAADPGAVELAEEKAAEFESAATALAVAEAGGEVLTMCANAEPAAGEATSNTRTFRPSTIVDADGRIKLKPLD